MFIQDIGRLMLGFLVLVGGIHILQDSDTWSRQLSSMKNAQIYLYDNVVHRDQQIVEVI